MWTFLAGARRTLPSENPRLDLTRIGALVSDRLNLPVTVKLSGSAVLATAYLDATVLGSLTETQIVNRLTTRLRAVAEQANL